MNQGFGGTFDACQEGTAVYAVWSDNRSGTVKIFFNRSTDGGITWDPVDVRIDHSPPAIHAVEPRIAHQGSRLYVVWLDERSGAEDVYLNYSADGGTTWQAVDRQLDLGTAATFSVSPKIACSGDVVAVAWREYANGGDLLTNVSTDGGVTWQPAAVRIDRGPGNSSAGDAAISCSSAGVFVAWTDTRNGGGTDLFFNRSVDGGATWLVNDVRIDSGSPGVGSAVGVTVASSGSTVYATWSESRTHNMALFNRSLDAGLTWLPSDVEIDHPPPGTPLDQVHMCCSGSTVYAVWRDGRNGNSDMYFNRSTDSGTTWMPVDIRVDTDVPAASFSQEFSLACSGNYVYAAWHDGRYADSVFYSRSVDGGLTWLSPDQKANPFQSSMYIPKVTCSGAESCVFWIQDNVGAAPRTLQSNRWVP